MAYEGRCGSCENFEDPKGRGIPYDTGNPCYVKGFCTWYKVYYYPDDKCDTHYRKRGSASSGCYITTMCHSILGMSDKSDTMQTVRSLRDNVMQKDKKYERALYEYDSIGPQIAERLKTEDKKVVKGIYNIHLLPIVKLIKKQKNEEAINRYRIMTYMLADMYGIEIKSTIPEDYDYTKGGHGKIK